MSDAERKMILEILTELYSEDDYNAAVYHMPTETSDASGEKFNEYFDFLQKLFLIKGSFMFMEQGELQAALGKIKAEAIKYSYPVNQLVGL